MNQFSADHRTYIRSYPCDPKWPNWGE